MRIARPAQKILISLGLACFLAARLFSQPLGVPKISAFAPAEDLIQQVDFFIGRVEESLADPADFAGAKQSRTVKDGNTLAVLALMLALHDEEHRLKASMPAMLASAQSLATADDNFEQARTALAGIKAARAETAPQGPPAKWEKVASLAALMKQVPLIHSGLKRGADPKRLARQAVQSAGQSAALAAIAEASMLDTEHAKSPDDVEKWRQSCAQMRDAAAEVNGAVHAQDQERVAAGMKRLLVSCDACHAKFRSP
jgi:cytochrome c556